MESAFISTGALIASSSVIAWTLWELSRTNKLIDIMVFHGEVFREPVHFNDIQLNMPPLCNW